MAVEAWYTQSSAPCPLLRNMWKLKVTAPRATWTAQISSSSRPYPSAEATAPLEHLTSFPTYPQLIPSPAALQHSQACLSDPCVQLLLTGSTPPSGLACSPRSAAVPSLCRDGAFWPIPPLPVPSAHDKIQTSPQSPTPEAPLGAVHRLFMMPCLVNFFFLIKHKNYRFHHL